MSVIRARRLHLWGRTLPVPALPSDKNPVSDLLRLVREYEATAPPAAPETDDEREDRERRRSAAERALVENRLKEVRRDRDHRDEVLRVEYPSNPRRSKDRFVEDLFLYEQSEGQDGKGRPIWNNIHKAVGNYHAYALNGVPKCQVRTQGREFEGPWHPDVAAFYKREAEATAARISKVVADDLVRNQWPDIQDRVLKDAAVLGVGYVVFSDDEALDVGDPRVARLLSGGADATRSASRRAALERLKAETRMAWCDPRSVYWQAGVPNASDIAHGQKMRRVSVVNHLQTEPLRLETGRSEIESGAAGFTEYPATGRGARSSRTASGRVPTTAVVETWEVVEWEEDVEVTETLVGPGDLPVVHVRRHRQHRSVLVKTVLAGNTLLSVRTWTDQEREVALPVVPAYLEEAADHPYGKSLTRRLALVQRYVNELRVLLFEQGSRVFSNQSVAIDANKLGSRDDAAEIVKAIRQGEPFVVHGNQDADDAIAGKHVLSDVFFAPASATPSGLNAETLQLLRMELETFNSMSEMASSEELLRARTGLGKQKAMDAADRAKISMLSLLARFVEAVHERCAGNWRRVSGPQVVFAGEDYVRLNEPVRERVPRLDEFGEPRPNPLYDPEMAAIVAEYPDLAASAPRELLEPYLMAEVEGRFGDTSAPVYATSDSRSFLPSDPVLKLQMLSAMAEQGMELLLPETIRDEVIPEGLRAKDDKYRERRARLEAEFQARALQQGGLAAASSDEGPERGPRAPALA